MSVQTCLNIFETGSKPRGILEKSLNILDKSSTWIAQKIKSDKKNQQLFS